MLRLLESLAAAIDTGVRAFIVVVLGTIVLLVLGEVVSRNLFGYSFHWLEEVTMTFLGTWLVFIGASHAMRAGMLASMDYMVRRLPRPMALACSIVSHAAVIIFLGVIIFYGVRLAAMASNQPSPSLQIPMAYAYAGLVIGACFMALHAVTTLATLIFRRAPDA